MSVTSPTKISFLLVPDFSMISLVSALEPLRATNRLTGSDCYSWTLYSDDGLPVKASNGMELGVDGGLPEMVSDLDDQSFLFVCAGLIADPPNRARLKSGLAQAARTGAVIGSLSAGTFLLARAGLLDGYRCTIHWEWQPAFEEAFPELDCTSGVYVIDGKRWTGSGGITGLDMMLYLIERDHGAELARSVGNQFQIDRARNSAMHQRPGDLERTDTLPEPVQKAIHLMQENIEEPIKIERIAELTSVNLRRMERMFKTYLSSAPARYYRRIRLEKARELLMHSNLSTLEISVLTGFSSSSHFAMAYSREFGVRPSDTRRPTGDNEG